MALTLYLHPLSSFCWKALIALYENDTPFEPRIIDLGDEASRAALEAIWPVCKFPVLRDEARGRTIPEATIIVEHLSLHHPGPVRLVPDDADAALEVRAWDRFFDLYVNTPMQQLVAQSRRPESERDAQAGARAWTLLGTAFALVDAQVEGRPWATGDAFTMADCAAAPALYYANLVRPLLDERDAHPATAAYLARLVERPSFARVLREARPYFELLPPAVGGR